MNEKEKLVKELYDIVQAKRLEIENAEKPCWNTGGAFRYSANSAHDSTNIRTVTDTRKLVDMFAFLIDRKDKTDSASEQLGVNYDFKWLGFTVDEWKEDIKTRINQIKIKEKRKELDTYEKKLNKISPELKEQLELDEMTKILKGTSN